MRGLIPFIMNQVDNVRRKLDEGAARARKYDLHVLIGVILNHINREMGNRHTPDLWLRPGNVISREMMSRVQINVLYDYLDRVQLRHANPEMDTDLKSRDIQRVFDDMLQGSFNDPVRVDNVITALVALNTGDLREYPGLKSAYDLLLRSREEGSRAEN